MKIEKDIYIDIDKKTFFLGSINADVELKDNVSESDESILIDLKNNVIVELLNKDISQLNTVLLEIINSFNYSGEIDTILSIKSEGNVKKIFITLSENIKDIEIFSEIIEGTENEILEMFINIINNKDSNDLLTLLSLQVFSNIKKRDDINIILGNSDYNMLEKIYNNLQGITSIR